MKDESMVRGNIEHVFARILGRQIGTLFLNKEIIKEYVLTVLGSRLQEFVEEEINDIYRNRSNQNYRGAVLLKLVLEC